MSASFASDKVDGAAKAETSHSEPVRHSDKPQTTLKEDVHDTAPGLVGVLERHGRVDLNPMPSDDPADPLNWSRWKKDGLLLQIAFHAMLGPFSAAAMIPAFEAYAVDFDISITLAAYFVSVPILFLGVAPFVWAPLAMRIGRRPVYLISAIGSAALHLGGAYCNSYGSMMTLRVFQAIFISPPSAIGATSINEMFFEHERGQRLGVWALMVGLGPPVAPLIFGFISVSRLYGMSPVQTLRAKRIAWHWIFYIIAIVQLAEFILYIPFGPETLYKRSPRDPHTGKDTWVPSNNIASKLSNYSVYRPNPDMKWSTFAKEVVAPLQMFLCLPVFLSALAYAIAFTYSNVLLTVEIPALLSTKMGLNAQQTGLQFIAPIIGCLLGEPIAGYGSDRYMAWRVKQKGERIPEMRLPFALPGFIICAVGLIIFGVQLQNVTAGVWNVTPDVGSGIALFGLQLVTTVCITYALDSMVPSKRHLAALFVPFLRSLYAFTGPFYFSMQYANMGAAKASGLLAALIGGVAFLMVVACMMFGGKWRQKWQ